jgi:hypothetical protein
VKNEAKLSQNDAKQTNKLGHHENCHATRQLYPHVTSDKYLVIVRILMRRKTCIHYDASFQIDTRGPDLHFLPYKVSRPL